MLTMPKRFHPAEYAQLGAELECDANQKQCQEFAAKFWQSADRAMASLACFALFKAKAIESRLAGRIEEALVAERNAQTVHERDIREENRW